VLLASVFTIIRRITGSAGAAAVFTLGLFATIGIWQYATLVEVYLPAMGCLAVILAVLHVPRAEPLSIAEQGAIVALFVLGVLYDQITVLFALPLAVLLVPRLGTRRILRAAGLIVAAGGIVLAVYASAYFTVSGPKTPSGFIHWCLLYAFHPDPSWGSWSNLSLFGLGKLFLSFARIVLAVPRALWIPSAGAAAVVLGAGAFLTGRAVVRRKPEANFRIAAALWILGTAAFVLWFTPAGHELIIPLLLPLIYLVVRLLTDAWESESSSPAVRRWILGSAGAIVAGLLVFNFITVVWPAHADRGDSYARAVQINSLAPAGAKIVADYFLMENLQYYFGREDVLDESIVLFSYFRGLEIPAEMIPSPGRPVLVPVSFLVPETKLARPFNGNDHPVEWRSFIEGICGCEIRDGRVIAARSPSAVAGLPGYLLLNGDRHPVDGLAGLFRSLDEEAAAVAPDFAGSFSAWLRSHPDESR
jgi:hypothetical protein